MFAPRSDFVWKCSDLIRKYSNVVRKCPAGRSLEATATTTGAQASQRGQSRLPHLIPTNCRAEAYKKLLQREQRPWKAQLSGQEARAKGQTLPVVGRVRTCAGRLHPAGAGQLSWLQEGSRGRLRASDIKSSCRMRWQKAE